jgi:hypothetical protein
MNRWPWIVSVGVDTTQFPPAETTPAIAPPALGAPPMAITPTM